SRAIGYDRIQPKPIVNAVAGAVLGLLFGIGLVLLLTWMESDLLRTPAAVERALAIPVLGAISGGSESKETAASVGQPGRMGAPKTA
ncbi:MAG: hypothetical protein HC802_09630, partial [Caldilineaceae bacterium]|nr:hypothetical protein [Caldilineaceae bacterium]